jgi:hypothetical protein
MSTLFRYPLGFVVIGAITALSFQALGKFGSTDPLERDWGMALDRDLTKLRISGRLDAKKFPWSDTYVESGESPLLARWYRTEFKPAERYRKRAPHLDELTKMDRATRSRVANESPAANLLDLAAGRADYPNEKAIRAKLRGGKGARALEEGLGFGWAVAATKFREPNAVSRTVRLPTGHELDLEIGSSDVKIGMAYYYGVVAREKVKRFQIGSRCHGANDRRCQRIDAATFHILLTNTIYEKGEPFVADIDSSEKVDLRPIGGFESDIRALPGRDRVFRVTTSVDYARRHLPQKSPYGFYNLDAAREEYTYQLEVDADGKIVRGDWVGERRPEFVWRVKELPPTDLGGFPALPRLYEEAPLLEEATFAHSF